MQVSAIKNFSYGQSLMAHKAVENPQPEQKPVEDQGLTASIYFGQKQKGNKMRNATMATLGSLALLTAAPSLSSCDKNHEDIYVTARAEGEATAIANAEANAKACLNVHAKGCCCDGCRKGKDTVYQYIPGDTIYMPGDTVIKYLPGDTVIKYLPGDTVKETIVIPGEKETIYVKGDVVHDTIKERVEVPVPYEVVKEVPVEVPVYIEVPVYVDTGSYHVDTVKIKEWVDRWQKPIPLDTLDKWVNKFDIPTSDPSRKNIVNYQGIREWEYGDRFTANANLLESSKNIMVYDREDLDWTGNHKGWGKDVYRIPTSNFTIQTYSGNTLRNPKGVFYETYVSRSDQNTSIYDNNLVQRYFLQTNGDKVKVYSEDPATGLYREDGEFSKGYLDKSEVGGNILLSNLIASDPEIRWTNNPDYATEDHMVGVKVVTVNDEELQMMYVRAKDDEFAEQNYGVAQ